MFKIFIGGTKNQLGSVCGLLARVLLYMAQCYMIPENLGVVIFLENRARAFLGGNFRLPFDTKLNVTAQGTRGVNGYVLKFDDFVAREMAGSASLLPSILAKNYPINKIQIDLWDYI